MIDYNDEPKSIYTLAATQTINVRNAYWEHETNKTSENEILNITDNLYFFTLNNIGINNPKVK